MEDKAAVTIGGRQVGPVLAPRALCALSTCDARMGGASLVKPTTRRGRGTNIGDTIYYDCLAAYVSTTDGPTVGKNGTAFTALRSRGEEIPLIVVVVVRYASRCVDASEFRRAITRREREQGKVRSPTCPAGRFTTARQFASHLPESGVFPRERLIRSRLPYRLLR